jgi:prepilin-type N-terminal cleavage/methylation domain-containing protein
MKCVRYGFVLIELIVATLIASILSGVLLTALSQSARVQASVDNTINISERIGIVVGQLEKDLAGAFVPSSAEASDSAKATSDTTAGMPDDKGSVEKTSDTQSSSAKATADKKTEEKVTQKKEPKKIEKIFYATNKDGMLDTLTFVTNNPLVVFVGKDVGVVKPKMVRVQYTLKPDPDNKESFILFRQEGNELDLAEYKNVRPYEVIGGIKKLSVSYTARLEKKEESASAKASADTKKEKPKKLYEYKVQPEWVSEQKKDANKDTTKDGDKKEQEFPRIPHSVEFKMTLWDKANNKDKEFTFVCAIPVDSIEAQPSYAEASEGTAKEKPAAPADAKQQGQQGQKMVRSTHVQKKEVVVYNESDIEAALANAMESLKKLLGHA